MARRSSFETRPRGPGALPSLEGSRNHDPDTVVVVAMAALLNWAHVDLENNNMPYGVHT